MTPEDLLHPCLAPLCDLCSILRCTSLIKQNEPVDKNNGDDHFMRKGDCCDRVYHGNADRSDSECLQHFPDEENDG